MEERVLAQTGVTGQEESGVRLGGQGHCSVWSKAVRRAGHIWGRGLVLAQGCVVGFRHGVQVPVVLDTAVHRAGHIWDGCSVCVVLGGASRRGRVL